MYKTEANLRSAFSEESQAHIRYTLYASKASADGLPALAALFRAAAQAEMIHARNHFSAMGALGSSKDNLLAAATSEHYAMTRVYPGLIEDAQVDRNEFARTSFDYAFKAEQVHNRIFENALAVTRQGQKIENDKYFVCSICGNLEEKEIPSKCPICNNSAEKYIKVD